MAESPIQKLKRLAAEKKAAEALANQPKKEAEVKQDDKPLASNSDNGDAVTPASDSVPALQENRGSDLEGLAPDQAATSEREEHPDSDSSDTGIVCTDSSDSSGESSYPVETQRASPTHPIAMEMAELEDALNKNVPGFNVILRDIHIKLREDPNTVTLLTDEEIAIIVKGLERHANVTLTSKAAKPSTRAKKVPISAADL